MPRGGEVKNSWTIVTFAGKPQGMSEQETLDARGLLCPLPVLKVQKRMRLLAAGEELIVLTDDPAAEIDMPHYCAESGNVLVSAEDHEGGHRFRLRKV